MKYIDAEKLIAEIERRKEQIGRRLDNIVPIRRKDTMDEEQLAKIELRDKVDKAYLNGVLVTLSDILSFITSLQQEQPMPDSTKLIELWHEDKEVLKEKDFRNDPWRLAYNAFMCGFGRGIAVKHEQPELDLEEDVDDKYIERSLAKVRLEKELAEYTEGWEDDEELGLVFTNDYGTLQIELDDVRDLARHFYELGLNARKEEKI